MMEPMIAQRDRYFVACQSQEFTRYPVRDTCLRRPCVEEWVSRDMAASHATWFRLPVTIVRAVLLCSRIALSPAVNRLTMHGQGALPLSAEEGPSWHYQGCILQSGSADDGPPTPLLTWIFVPTTRSDASIPLGPMTPESVGSHLGSFFASRACPGSATG